LVGGLVGVVPLLTLTGRLIGGPFSHPIIMPLGGTAVVGAGYIASLWLLNELRRGSVIGMICLSTFAANIPLTAGTNSYPGGLGPILWLYQLPLAVVVIFWIRERWWIDGSVSIYHWPHFAFVVFTLWTLVPVVMGIATRPLVALAFTLHIAIGGLVFAIVSAAVFNDILSLRDVISSLIISVLGHATFAIFQLLNQNSLGITVLGETSQMQTRAVIAGVKIGTYLSGFTGGSSNFSTLLVLIAPVITVFAVSKFDWLHLFAAGCSVGFYTLVRLTERDASRGGALVAIVISVIAVVVVQAGRFDRFTIMIRQTRTWLSGILLSAISILVLLVPSSTSGSKSQVKRQVGSSGGQSGSSGGQFGGESGSSDLLAGSAADAVAGANLPFFDLSTLGIRASQYAVAAVTFFEHPLTGVGGGNLAYLGVDYGLPVLDGLGRTWAVHNAYLGVLAETGIVGFVLFISILASGLIAAVRLARSQAIPRWVTVGSGCGLLAVYAIMFWTVAVVSIPVWIPMLVLIGALVGACQRQ